MDCNEQCSSNVKEAPNQKRAKCNSIAKVRKWDNTYFRYGFFLPNDQILNVAAKFQKCKNKRVIFRFCNNCLFVQVSKNEILDFLKSNLCLKKFFGGVPWQTRKYIRSSSMTKRLKSTVLFVSGGLAMFDRIKLPRMYSNQSQIKLPVATPALGSYCERVEYSLPYI